MTNFEISVMFFLQLFVILIVCRLVGMLARYLGQPQVVGEMIAGVVLGPSLFGLLAPDLQKMLFPKESKTIIYVVSQMGLVLYMFVIGLEFNAKLIQSRIRSAASVSAAGILAPFALGGVIAVFLVNDHGLFGNNVSPFIAALFLGSAMSITAFPMLARIIHERGLANTSLGTLALAAGSIDDAAAWCVLAVVLASFKGSASIAILAIGGGSLFVILTLTVVRPLLRPLGRIVERQGSMSWGMLSFVLALVALGAVITDSLGIYAVFGAFIMGVAMPRGKFTEELIGKIEPLTATFILPLFFINSGLNTKIGLIDQPYLWLIAGLILVAAVAGKWAACWLAARLNGEGQRDALAVGCLMNARGLMELIALSIGLEHGIITPTLFTIMVIMAITTTLMASPLFELVYRRFRHHEVEATPAVSGRALETAEKAA